MQNSSVQTIRPARNLTGYDPPARRQIHFPSLRNAGRHRRRRHADRELFHRSRLRQHSRLRAWPRRAVGNDDGGTRSDPRQRPAAASAESTAGLRQLRLNHPHDQRHSRWPEFHQRTIRRRVALSQRPMARVITPLEEMGAKITSKDGGRPPLRITGGKLHAIEYNMPVPSAQVKSCLLLRRIVRRWRNQNSESIRTRDHGEVALRAFGAEVKRDGTQVSISGGQKLHGIEAVIPGDISSSAFFLCAAALFPGSQSDHHSFVDEPNPRPPVRCADRHGPANQPDSGGRASR